MCLQSVSARTQWRNILETSANWEGEMTIQISAHLDITPTPSESRGQCHARVETLGVEGMPAMHGIKLRIPSFHAEKN